MTSYVRATLPLTPELCDVLRFLIAAGERVLRDAGLPADPRISALKAELASFTRHRDAAQLPTPNPVPDSWVTTKQASLMTGKGMRQLQRCATDFGGRLVGGRWYFDPRKVL